MIPEQSRMYTQVTRGTGQPGKYVKSFFLTGKPFRDFRRLPDVLLFYPFHNNGGRISAPNRLQEVLAHVVRQHTVPLFLLGQLERYLHIENGTAARRGKRGGGDRGGAGAGGGGVVTYKTIEEIKKIET